MGEEPIHCVKKEGHGTEEIHDEDDTEAIALVVDFVLPAVIEENAASLLPGVDLIFDTHGRRIIYRYFESEVIAKVAEVGATVCRNGLAGIEDGEECLIDIGDFFEERRGARASFLICFGCACEGAQHENFPVLVSVDGS